MNKLARWILAASLGAVLFAEAWTVDGATYPRDDSGTPAAQCAFLGTAGASTLCSATDPLPITGGGNVTTSTTDPAGWAQTWNIGTAPTTANLMQFAPVYLSANLAYAFARKDSLADNGFDFWVSKTSGRTWTLGGTVTINTGTFRAASAVLRLPNGNFLIGGSTLAGITPGNTGLGVWAGSGTFTQIALPGLPINNSVAVYGLAQQGSTVLASVSGAGSASYICRSVNSGVSFTCGAQVGTHPNTAQPLASVAPNVWLLSNAPNVLRSTDDGQTWGNATGAGSSGAVACLDATTCLITRQALVLRSTNAGATFSTAFTSPVNGLFVGIVNYGGGLAAVLPNAAASVIYLTRDSGVSWVPIFTLAAGQRCGLPCNVAVNGGNAIATFDDVSATNKVLYSATLPAGGQLLVGPTGIPAQVDANGRLLTNPTWTVAGPVTIAATVPATPLLTTPVQSQTLQNSSTTGAADTPVVVTLAAVAAVRHHLYSVAAYCSAGTASLTITDGGVTKWNPPAAAVGTTLFSATWPVALTFATNSAAVVTLSTCGAGNTGTLIVQSDRSAGL